MEKLLVGVGISSLNKPIKNIRTPNRGPDIFTSKTTYLLLVDRVLRRHHIAWSEG